jgi:hypothetical protein
MAAWLGVVSAEHVARGVRLGIAQTNHGKRTGLARMQPGDWLVYYSPQERLGERTPVQAFTAIGQLADDRIWQADEGDFKPWRRTVSYRPDARRVPIADLHHRLDLTAAPNWGYRLRRGLVPLTDADLSVILAAMTGTSAP